jgi:hypothetical protein
MPLLVDITHITRFCRLGSVLCALHTGTVCFNIYSKPVITLSRQAPIASARNPPLHCLTDRAGFDFGIQAVPFVFWRQFTHRWFVMNL